MRLKSILNYCQPDFYHFSEDSILLANEAVKRVNKATGDTLKVLDLCSGCGVVGLELFQKSANDISIDFCEMQSEFEPFFIENVRQLGTDNLKNLVFNNTTIRDMLVHAKKSYYDFLVCNPPYFTLKKFKISKNEQRKLCRFFIEDSFEQLLELSSAILKIGGEAIIIAHETFKDEVYNFRNRKKEDIKIEELVVGGSFTIFLITVLNKN